MRKKIDTQKDKFAKIYAKAEFAAELAEFVAELAQKYSGISGIGLFWKRAESGAEFTF